MGFQVLDCVLRRYLSIGCLTCRLCAGCAIKFSLLLIVYLNLWLIEFAIVVVLKAIDCGMTHTTPIVGRADVGGLGLGCFCGFRDSLMVWFGNR